MHAGSGNVFDKHAMEKHCQEAERGLKKRKCGDRFSINEPHRGTEEKGTDLLTQTNATLWWRLCCIALAQTVFFVFLSEVNEESEAARLR